MKYSKLNIILFLIWIVSGCGYYSVKGSIPDHIKSIFIHPVENLSSGNDIVEFLNKEIDVKEINSAIQETEYSSYTTSYVIYQLLEDNSYLETAYNQIQEKANNLESDVAAKFLSYPIPKAIVEEWEKVK